MLTPLPSAALLPVYATMPVRPVSGRGSWLIDEDGRKWLDAYGGHAVASSGHSHPHVVEAIARQAATLLFYSTAVRLPQREALAESLVARCPAPLARVFFSNSGAEANENALNLARRATGRRLIVTLQGGWHGRTAATLALCDGSRYEQGAERAGVALSRRVPFNDIAALDSAIDADVAAVMIEPVQGMAGARAVSREFLTAARSLCSARGVALIFDEVQCGVGRSGAFTAAEVYGVVPDLLTLAKGLGAGLPIGATIATEAITSGIAVGDLGSTFGGGPVPCAAALANLEVIESEALIQNAQMMGTWLRERAVSIGLPQPDGLGLLVGVRLPQRASQVQSSLFEKRVLTGTSSDSHVMRWMPPLSFSPAEAGLLIDSLQEVLNA